MKKSLLAFTLPGLFYPVSFSGKMGPGSTPLQARIGDHTLVLYRNATSHVVAHTDICPHQGASFAQTGTLVRPQGHLVCGYHGFQFRQGQFLGLPPRACGGGHRGYQMHLWETLEHDGLVYLRVPPTPRTTPRPVDVVAAHESMDVVPEARDSAFRKVTGSRSIAQNHQVVTENVLDMMHVSYVHKSFGNRASPLPTNVDYHALGPFSGRSTFTYVPRPGSLASFLNPLIPQVIVENEFHLPTTTVTRVRTQQYVKTVVTRALPQGNMSTKLFWEVHRNFGCDSIGIGDRAMAFLMERTLDEDVDLLRHVNPEHRDGPLRTKYDITIRKYRAAVQQWIHHVVVSTRFLL